MLLFERQADTSWLPTTVILATPKRLQGKALPGSPDRDARLARILTDALPPRINDQTEERGTFEDWISWGTYNLANGHTTWATEIKPEGTVDTLYEREVANVVGSLRPVAQAVETDPVGHESGIELVEITEGAIFARPLPNTMPGYRADQLPPPPAISRSRTWRARRRGSQASAGWSASISSRR